MKKTLLALAMTTGLGLYIGHISVATAHNIADSHIQAIAEASYQAEAVTPPSYSAQDGIYALDVYEDGSGVLYHDDLEVYTFDSDSFPWDCTDNGNAICGPDAPAEVQGYRCAQWVYAPDQVVLHYCTDGDFDTWKADDVDAEGETIG